MQELAVGTATATSESHSSSGKFAMTSFTAADGAESYKDWGSGQPADPTYASGRREERFIP